MNPPSVNAPANSVASDRVAVQLTPFEWHLLLRELEHSFRSVNLDRSNAVHIYEAISTQLAGVSVEYMLPKAPVTAPVSAADTCNAAIPAAKPSWWKRLVT